MPKGHGRCEIGPENKNWPWVAKNATERRQEPKEGAEEKNKGPGVEETGAEAGGI